MNAEAKRAQKRHARKLRQAAWWKEQNGPITVAEQEESRKRSAEIAGELYPGVPWEDVLAAEEEEYILESGLTRIICLELDQLRRQVRVPNDFSLCNICRKPAAFLLCGVAAEETPLEFNSVGTRFIRHVRRAQGTNWEEPLCSECSTKINAALQKQ